MSHSNDQHTTCYRVYISHACRVGLTRPRQHCVWRTCESPCADAQNSCCCHHCCQELERTWLGLGAQWAKMESLLRRPVCCLVSEGASSMPAPPALASSLGTHSLSSQDSCTAVAPHGRLQHSPIISALYGSDFGACNWMNAMSCTAVKLALALSLDFSVAYH